MKRSVVLETHLFTITQSQKRPEEQRTWAMDVASFNQKDFELLPNNQSETIEESTQSFGPATKFVSVYSPNPIDLIINTQTFQDFRGLFILSAPVLLFRLTNRSISKSAVCSAIYA